MLLLNIQLAEWVFEFVCRINVEFLPFPNNISICSNTVLVVIACLANHKYLCKSMSAFLIFVVIIVIIYDIDISYCISFKDSKTFFVYIICSPLYYILKLLNELQFMLVLVRLMHLFVSWLISSSAMFIFFLLLFLFYLLYLFNILFTILGNDGSVTLLLLL